MVKNPCVYRGSPYMTYTDEDDCALNGPSMKDSLVAASSKPALIDTRDPIRNSMALTSEHILSGLEMEDTIHPYSKNRSDLNDSEVVRRRSDCRTEIEEAVYAGSQV